MIQRSPLQASANHTVDTQAVLDALESDRSRLLLTVLGEQTLTANEIAPRTDIPRSSLYRYLNRLVDAGLVRETIRLDGTGRHEQEYSRAVSEVVLSMSGPECTIDLR